MVLLPGLLPHLVHQAAIVAAEQVHLPRVDSHIRVLSWGVLQADTQQTLSDVLTAASCLDHNKARQQCTLLGVHTSGDSRLMAVHILNLE
jgi:hypothetical protein